jgi:hypothetical protein
MAIVRERRGTMYDPAVVDAFESIQAAIESEPVGELLPEVLDKFAQTAREMRRVETVPETVPLELRVSATEMLLQLYSQLSVLGPGAGVDVTCDTVSRCLLRLAPAGLVVFYRHDDAAEEVVTAYASGFGEALARDVRMALGHGVSGWVAANGRSVINADAALDLGHRMDGLEPGFRSVLSIPLIQPHGIVGVLGPVERPERKRLPPQGQAIQHRRAMLREMPVVDGGVLHHVTGPDDAIRHLLEPLGSEVLDRSARGAAEEVADPVRQDPVHLLGRKAVVDVEVDPHPVLARLVLALAEDGDLLAQHNEHRPFFPRLIRLASVAWDHWNLKHEMLFAWGLQVVVLVLLAGHVPDRTDVFSPVGVAADPQA